MRARTREAKTVTRETFKADLRRWAERIGVNPQRVQIQRMTRKWASCSPSGRLCFAADLLDQPAECREAVLVHELVHLVVPNHGKLFKSMMRAYLPGWETALRNCLAGTKTIC